MRCRYFFDINGENKNGADLSYDDLKTMILNYKNVHGVLPTTNDFTHKNNMPQARIVNQILKSIGSNYKDLIYDCGKVGRIRTENGNYDKYAERLKNLCNERGNNISPEDFTKYNLPSLSWYIKNSPDKNVCNYGDLMMSLSIPYTPKKIDKAYVDKALKDLQYKLGREITNKDIKNNNLGFSMIVVVRLYGTLGNAKKELGLFYNPKRSISSAMKKSHLYPNMREDFYKICDYFKENKRTEITKREISQCELFGDKSDFQTYMRAFSVENIDIYDIVKQYGFVFAESGNGVKRTYDDGEKCTSSLEIIFTNYLRNNLGLKYNLDYKRNVLYRTFSNTNRYYDCDYVVKYNNKTYYIELAGIIKPIEKENWEDIDYESKTKNKYRDGLKEKKVLAQGLNFYILFFDDMKYNIFDTIFKIK